MLSPTKIVALPLPTLRDRSKNSILRLAEVRTLNWLNDLCLHMPHDRIHARQPTHDIERWSVGTIEAVDERDGHYVFAVRDADGEMIDLVVTDAIRELVLRRLDLKEGESPAGSRVWYRKRGEGSSG